MVKIILFATFIKRLQNFDGESAVLYGISSNEAITVVTFLSREGDNVIDENVLPGGLERIGSFGSQIGSADSRNLLLIVKVGNECQCYIQNEGAIENVPFKIVEDLDLASLRMKCKITVLLSCKEQETDDLFEKLLIKINSGAASYLLSKSRVVLSCSSDNSILYGAPQDLNVEELASHIEFEEDEEFMKRKKRILDKNLPLQFQLYWSTVSEELTTSVPQYAPIIYHQRKNNKVVCLSLSLNVIAVIPWSHPAENIGHILSEALARQLKLLMKDLKEQLNHTSTQNVALPELLIFHPEQLQHYVILAYHPKKSDQSLENYRKEVHNFFGLPMSKPVFRRKNKCWFIEDYETNSKLINPHLGLNNTGRNVVIVHGRYAYHHYMQDNFDDNGWGCAYRSLQTIISWFQLQGYTDRPIPTHHEIQQCLVDIGDKPASFVKSKKWIGSMEVSFCLQTLIGIQSTILNVSSGNEMSYKARQIGEHFLTQGTPIMIGGGVLAHTIIGIDYDDDNGDVRYLILDPHYTGDEDLRVIQNKGWCNWKSSNFWKSDSFYNLCMPLRPITF